MLLDKLKDISTVLVNIDERIGFKKFVKYVILGLFVVMAVNYKTVLRDMIEIVTEISEDIHSQKMELRDQLLEELYPILSEFRSDVRADRILYFEYHNSKENLISIPFKYVELVQQSARYSIPNVNEEKYKNINSGAITSIYQDIKLGEIVYCSGPYDDYFKTKYPGVFELINSKDGSKRQIYISIPGIDQPVGMIILEWMDETNQELDIQGITKTATQNYIPRINALILSKSKVNKRGRF